MYAGNIRIEDHLRIQALVAEYSFRCDTKQYEELSQLFTPDGVFDESVVGIPRADGSESLETTFRGMDGLIDFLTHLTSNHRIDLSDADRATGTIHVHVKGSYRGTEIEILGYYMDEYVRRNGSWLFGRRTLVEISPSTGFEALKAASGASTG